MTFDFMSFMEAMGSSDVPWLAAFFIGLMNAISPCPLANNITAIAYVSRKIGSSRHTLLVGLFYTLGRMAAYVALASFIVYLGLEIQGVSLFLQQYGWQIFGPLLILLGLLMLDFVNLEWLTVSSGSEKLKEHLANKGFLGSFLLGVLFALAFCPFSAVLFFGMLIPLSLKTGDGIILPSVFAFATGLPVIIFSLIMVYGVNRLGLIVNRVQAFEKWIRKGVAVVFILAGIYSILQSTGLVV